MPLEREMVVREALALLNDVGLDGLTVRRLAERLGVQNPALYWHFKNKQELLNRMAEVMLAEAFAGIEQSPAADMWAEWLTDLARRLRRALLACRDGALLIATADLAGSQQLVGLDLALRVLTNAGFDLRVALVGTVAIFDYTLGATIEEQLEPAYSRAVGSDTSGAGRNPFDAARLPMLTRALNEMPDLAGNRARGFEEGVQLILAGMRASLPPLPESSRDSTLSGRG